MLRAFVIGMAVGVPIIARNADILGIIALAIIAMACVPPPAMACAVVVDTSRAGSPIPSRTHVGCLFDTASGVADHSSAAGGAERLPCQFDVLTRAGIAGNDDGAQ